MAKNIGCCVGMILLAMLAVPAWGQSERQIEHRQSETRPGVGVDARGGQAVDPTENVKALNAAEAKRQDDLRQAEAKFQNAIQARDIKRIDDLVLSEAKRVNELREADVRRLNELREAETRRVNELATQKQIFDLELARVIRAGLDASTLLLATQLKEVKTDASDRMAKLEQFANEQRGRASATGPGDIKLSEDVKVLIQAAASRSGSDQGSATTWALIGTIIIMVLMFAGLLVNVFSTRSKTR